MAEEKAFVIVQIAIEDPDGYQQYMLAGHQEIFDRYRAKLVGVDDEVDVVEGTWPYTRTVILEFPNKGLARSWYESEEYQAVVGLRHDAATSNLVIVAGYPG